MDTLHLVKLHTDSPQRWTKASSNPLKLNLLRTSPCTRLARDTPAPAPEPPPLPTELPSDRQSPGDLGLELGSDRGSDADLGRVRAKNTFIFATTVSDKSCTHQCDFDGGGRHSAATSATFADDDLHATCKNRNRNIDPSPRTSLK